jgi:signal transduction histidine kinase/CheY-like chemotaxis protein
LDWGTLAALIASFVFLGAVIVASTGRRMPSYWALSWGLMIATGVLLALGPAPVLQEVARFGASLFPGLQLAGAYQYVGRRVPSWVAPVALFTALVRCGVALSGYPELSHGAVLILELGVIAWSARVVLGRDPAMRDAMDWLLALGAAALCGLQAIDALVDIGRSEGFVMWAPWLVLGAAVGMLQTLGVNERILRVAAEKRREREERQRTAQRLESLGALAGGIAHDFNNLLTGILGNAELAEVELEEGHPARAHVEEIAAGTLTAADLAGQMLAYASGRRLEPQAVDLARALRERAALLRSAASTQVKFEIDAPVDLPHVLADPSQLDQVLLNLAINAGEACGSEGGTVRIELDLVVILGEVPATAIGELSDGRYLRLAFIDDGCGFQVEPASRIFDPFFSTKFSGRGMGLAVTQQIVRAHGGAIAVRSSAAGTRFEVYLPVPDSEVVEGAKRRPPAVAPAERAHILAVDDDAQVLAVVSRALCDEGHEVTLAAGGREAIEALGDASFAPSLLLLDATMPDVSAREVIRAVKRTHPGLPIVMMTGHDTDRLSEELDEPEILGWIRKPFRLSTLQERISEYLGERL